MEAISQEPVSSPITSPRGFKKVLSNRSRTAVQDTGSENGSIRGLPGRKSEDSAKEHSPMDLSRISSRDDSSKSGSSGIRKLIPGLEKRKRRRMRENAALLHPGSESADDNPVTNHNTNAPAIERSHSSTSLLQDDNSSLLTDDSEPSSARPPLLNHDSHAGYLTHSSPLINTTTAVYDGPSIQHAQEQPTALSEQIARSPTLTGSNAPSIVQPPPLPADTSIPTLPSETPFDPTNTIGLPSDSRASRKKSISSSIRGISPGRKLKGAFHPGKSSKSPRTSPERKFLHGKGKEAREDEVNTNAAHAHDQTARPATSPAFGGKKPEPLDPPRKLKSGLAPINTQDRPQTPPSAGLDGPLTTVTPPTPVDARAPTLNSSTRSTATSPQANEASGIIVSPSGNMISHRRIRSDIGSLHQPSKLSNAISAPLTPTIAEARTPSVKSESRNVTQGSGLFASFVSAAQNAANTITNTLNTQNRSRSGTETTEPEKPLQTESEPKDPSVESSPSRKQLAVETLGTGDLKLSHLGIGTDSMENSTARPDVMEGRKDLAIKRDEAAAKVEDMLAKRAVSAAYEKFPENDSKTPVAELSDPMNSLRHSSTFNSNVSSTDVQTTPTGSVYEGESGTIKRNNSVRSRLRERRKRGASNATGTSTVGTLLAASSSSLANPTAGTKLTGFAIAPKSRNRSFHQLFRSVPEDDFLIEDYSCALQKEILLAGRIYISEGHICFSSNILGWVTTLIISFEEVMAIERETTAMVFPNAIAVQTLHARHIFRSLLSREATFDLMVGIWKQSHPAAFKKSLTGKQAGDETTQATDKQVASESDSDEASEEEDEVYDEDEDDEGAGSFVEAGSAAGSEITDATASATRKTSAITGGATGSVMPYFPATADGGAAEKAAAAASAATADFPGPTTHPPTDCTDSATHYDKILKDESIPAPLGKIYSMLFGPTSGVFLTKYLVDEQKVTELQYEDDKKGLGEQNKTRSYSYIKPLYASIGPKQTKCITTENLDAFDLERSVSVTCTTQTPDVPSGNVFSVKTRYCLTWAPGNATRLQMNCTVEWTGKSWLKGPIEKGATDGQQTYGNDLVKALKAAVSSRSRAATAGSKAGKSGKRKKKGDKSSTASPPSETVKVQKENWGLLEPLRGIFGPVVDIFQPFAAPLAGVTILLLLCVIWFRRPIPGSSSSSVGYPYSSSSARLAAYEEMWRKEESDLWSWLEDRVGMEGLALKKDEDAKKQKAEAKVRKRERQKVLGSRDVEARLREERMTEREMEDAIRVTQERLEVLKRVVERTKSEREGAAADGDDDDDGKESL